jgi:hypothetical protein
LGAFPALRAGNRAIRSNKNAGLGKGGVWGKAPNSENKNAQAFLFRFYPLRGSVFGAFFKERLKPLISDCRI